MEELLSRQDILFLSLVVEFDFLKNDKMTYHVSKERKKEEEIGIYWQPPKTMMFNYILSALDSAL